MFSSCRFQFLECQSFQQHVLPNSQPAASAWRSRPWKGHGKVVTLHQLFIKMMTIYCLFFIQVLKKLLSSLQTLTQTYFSLLNNQHTYTHTHTPFFHPQWLITSKINRQDGVGCMDGAIRLVDVTSHRHMTSGAVTVLPEFRQLTVANRWRHVSMVLLVLFIVVLCVF